VQSDFKRLGHELGQIQGVANGNKGAITTIQQARRHDAEAVSKAGTGKNMEPVIAKLKEELVKLSNNVESAAEQLRKQGLQQDKLGAETHQLRLQCAERRTGSAADGEFASRLRAVEKQQAVGYTFVVHGAGREIALRQDGTGDSLTDQICKEADMPVSSISRIVRLGVPEGTYATAAAGRKQTHQQEQQQRGGGGKDSSPPVRITVATEAARAAFFRAKFGLKAAKLYLDDDLTGEELRLRRERMERFKTLRTEGGTNRPVAWRRAAIVRWDPESRRWGLIPEPKTEPRVAAMSINAV
jgi:hypothetical protein